jgi:6-phosphogluconolactonase
MIEPIVPSIRVLQTPEQLAQAAADLVIAAANDCFAADREFVLALSGGRTPQRLFSLLAQRADEVNWAQVQVLFADERCVPPADPQSNFGVASRLLIDHVPLPFEHVHRMAGEKEPLAAAAEYDRLLQERFPTGPDLLLLGMGEDGHTASLFPQTTALAETQRACLANHVPQLGAWRLTMTYPYLNLAQRVAVLTEGAGKSKVINEVLEGRAGPMQYPIQGIQPLSRDLHWLMDAAAAGMFEEDAD